MCQNCQQDKNHQRNRPFVVFIDAEENKEQLMTFWRSKPIFYHVGISNHSKSLEYRSTLLTLTF